MNKIRLISIATVLIAGIVVYRTGRLQVLAASDAQIALKGTVTPESGRGREQVFEVKYNSRSGKPIKEVRLLISPFRDGAKACYLYYRPEEKAFLLVNNEGNGSQKLTLDGSSYIENGRCRLNAKGSSFSGGRANITARFALEFYPLFDGDKNLYLYAEDSDGKKTGLQQSGEWNVQPPASFLHSSSH